MISRRVFLQSAGASLAVYSALGTTGWAQEKNTENKEQDLAIELGRFKENDEWAFAGTKNFRVYHQHPKQKEADYKDLLKSALVTVEKTKKTMQNEWVGEETDLKPRCGVRLYSTGKEYEKMTKVSAANKGHSTMDVKDKKIDSMVIDARCDIVDLFENVLPHETAHIVLFHALEGKFPNRWADEGVAGTLETASAQQRHLLSLPKQREDFRFTAQKLMTMNYPEPQHLLRFYAQSLSLVKFLLKKGEKKDFIPFLRDADTDGYTSALENHFCLTFADLEKEWTAELFPDKKR